MFSSNRRLSAVQSGSSMPTKNKGWHQFPNNKHMPLLLILIPLFMDPIHPLLSQSHKNSSSWWSKDFVCVCVCVCVCIYIMQRISSCMPPLQKWRERDRTRSRQPSQLETIIMVIIKQDNKHYTWSYRIKRSFTGTSSSSSIVTSCP